MEILLRQESFAGNAVGICLLQKSFSAGRGQVNEELQDMENIGNPSPWGRGKGDRGLFPGVAARPANKAKPVLEKGEKTDGFRTLKIPQAALCDMSGNPPEPESTNGFF